MIALVMNQDFFGNRIFKAAVILPWTIPPVVVSIMWKWMLNPSLGIVNAVLLAAGIIDSYMLFFSSPLMALGIIILVDSWMNLPFVAIVLYATLQTIPPDLYEAAECDGAGIWAKFTRITLPLIRPGITVALIFTTIWSFRAFDLIFVLTGGGPGYATTTLNWFVYEIGFKNQHLGLASAVGLMLTAIIAVLTVIYVSFIYKEIKY